jgi:cytochrome b subunit of formate dehydrogenase
VNLNIGLKLMLVQAVVYSVSWIVTGIVIGLIYRPLAPR